MQRCHIQILRNSKKIGVTKLFILDEINFQTFKKTHAKCALLFEASQKP